MTTIGILEIVELNKTTKVNTSLEYLPYTNSIPVNLQQVITLGRDPTCDIQFDNFVISQLHGTIWSVQFDNETLPIVYMNDNSRNGIVHNGKELDKGMTVILQHGDSIEFKMAAKLKFTCSDLDCCSGVCSVDDKLTIEDWTLTDRLIGSGSFGSVYVASNRQYRKLFAVKVIPDAQASIPDKLIKQESNLLLSINHPNIVKVHDTITFDSNIYIFEDLICGGDLFSYLKREKYLRPIPEQETITIVYQLLKVIQYLHNELQIVHRDLKLDNILLEFPLPRTRIYVCDFGIAKNLAHCTQQKTDTCVGTIEYSAPEVFNEDKGYGFKCDLWSLGVIVHLLLSGISPFYGNGEKEIMITAARNGRVNLNRNQFKNTSLLCKRFIQDLLKVDPEERMSVDDCFNHDWIRLNQVNLEKFYQRRISNMSYQNSNYRPRSSDHYTPRSRQGYQSSTQKSTYNNFNRYDQQQHHSSSSSSSSSYAPRKRQPYTPSRQSVYTQHSSRYAQEPIQFQLWMGDLDNSWTEESIDHIWTSLVEKPKSVKIIRDRLNPMKSGYCFVTFHNQKAVDLAIQRNGQPVPSSNKYFKLNHASGAHGTSSTNRHSGTASSSENDFSMFVGDLGNEVSEALLFNKFNHKYPNQIKQVKVIIDPTTKKSKGFGFVRFLAGDVLNRALQEMNGVEIGSKAIRVGLASGSSLDMSKPGADGTGRTTIQKLDYKRVVVPQPQPELNQYTDANNTRLVITGLASKFTEQELELFFIGFGDLLSCKISSDFQIGYIKYYLRSSAEAAILNMQGCVINDCRLAINWASSDDETATTTYEKSTTPPLIFYSSEYDNVRLDKLDTRWK
ncbi:Meiosis-specific serine/threonine-protein kinase MEK1 [Spathaspora sp. JA1]|nr:Meiosis-specific serine/threonine-protein kinase MEK1 [Spathaspora sp. JA1]